MLKPSRPKSAAIGAVLVLALVALTGCGAPSNAPTDYDALTEENFIDGCTAISPPPETTVLGTGASQEYCQCTYAWFVNNLPFDDSDPAKYGGKTFTELNSSLGDDPEGMPDDIRTALSDACGTSAEPRTPPSTSPTTQGAEIPETTTSSVAG